MARDESPAVADWTDAAGRRMLPDGGAEETRQVALPERLAERVEARVARTEFDSVDAYVGFVVEEVLAVVEEETDEAATEVDEDEVRDRLESLGYLE